MKGSPVWKTAERYEWQRNTTFWGKKYLLVDDGGGSADFALVSVEKTGKGTRFGELKIVEEVPAETRWCGGAEVNSVAADVVIEEMPITAWKSLDWILNQIKESRLTKPKSKISNCKDPTLLNRLRLLHEDLSKNFDKATLHCELRRRIEFSKKHPSNLEERPLEIDGLPVIEGSLFCAGTGRGENSMKVTPQMLRKWFDPSIQTMATVTTNFLDAMNKTTRQSGQRRPPIHEFIVSGGATLNQYTQEELLRKVREWTEKQESHDQIPVKFVMKSNDPAAGLTKVALGGLLLLANSHLIRRRKIQREFFVANPATYPKNQESPRLYLRTKEMVYPLENQLVRFLTQDKQMPGKDELTHSAHVYLPMHRLQTEASGVEGWNEEIRVYCRDDRSKDGPKIDVEGTRVTDDDLEQFDSVILPLFIPKDFAMGTHQIESPSGKTYCRFVSTLRVRFKRTSIHFWFGIRQQRSPNEDPKVGKKMLGFEFQMKREGAFHPVGTAFPRE